MLFLKSIILIVDFLLKYDADSLLNCGSVKKTCTPSFEMYKNTISEAGGSCFKNFIVFNKVINLITLCCSNFCGIPRFFFVKCLFKFFFDFF